MLFTDQSIITKIYFTHGCVVVKSLIFIKHHSETIVVSFLRVSHVKWFCFWLFLQRERSLIVQSWLRALDPDSSAQKTPHRNARFIRFLQLHHVANLLHSHRFYQHSKRKAGTSLHSLIHTLTNTHTLLHPPHTHNNYNTHL